MKIFEKKIVPAATREVLVLRKCDLCGVLSKSASWDAGNYEVNETEIKITIRHKAGSDYPEGGDGEEYVIDLCPECFKNRLVPWLNMEGANIKSTEWSW